MFEDRLKLYSATAGRSQGVVKVRESTFAVYKVLPDCLPLRPA